MLMTFKGNEGLDALTQIASSVATTEEFAITASFIQSKISRAILVSPPLNASNKLFAAQCIDSEYF